MTWNVWWRFGGNWRERATGIKITLETYQPDVIGLVETWAGNGTTQPDELARILGLHAAFAPTSLPPAPDPIEHPDQAGVTVGLGLLSRWPILRTRVHELPHPQRGGEPPTALVATLDHPRGELHVIVTCREWEPHHAADRLAQSEALAELIMDPALDGPLPVLLVGDLNAPPDEPELAPLREVTVDTWEAGGGDPGVTTLDSLLPYAPLEATTLIDRRIDHVLVRPGRPGVAVTVRGAFIAGDRPIDGHYPSDHYAIGADLDP
ncbi:endonuclease/exonuclease/phosphatase [Actinoplanes friuliensis DSM 7358]|uniref:Endonuclease/exonuclease/phosphatase n=2 Tax=Actinoplanes friuliensis TaxID=196914 RepID=U5W667_9ACTN|nr:endonuclease/exonuclease/phosphatase [Actinoplanes friuliensis DSM 7358]